MATKRKREGGRARKQEWGVEGKERTRERQRETESDRDKDRLMATEEMQD